MTRIEEKQFLHCQSLTITYYLKSHSVIGSNRSMVVTNWIMRNARQFYLSYRKMTEGVN